MTHPLGDGGYIMSPQMAGLVSSRDRSVHYLLIACSLIVAISSTPISIKVAAAPVWSGDAPSTQTINPARKGDRFRLVLASDPSPANRPMEVSVPHTSVGHGLPDGCEALASPLARSAGADIAGRCVS
jgi:hypothetical protein